MTDLKEEVLSILSANRIYSIESFGWINENETDPDYIGYAMISTDSPGDDVLLGDFHGPKIRKISNIEMEKIQNIEDFFAVMEASRISIGLCMISPSSYPDSSDIIESLHPIHLLDTYLKLEIASDRLRKILILSSLNMTYAEYNKQKVENKKHFSTPFSECGKWISTIYPNSIISKIEKSVAFLEKSGLYIFENLISKRNSMVHEIATPWASKRKSVFEKLNNDFDQEKKFGFAPPDWDDIRYSEYQKFVENELSDKIDDDINIDAATTLYKRLIDMGNHVFIIEYRCRKSGDE